MNVYQAIAAVMVEMAKRGISKDRRNTQGIGYNFRGIDDVYNALAPLLATNGLVILPRMVGRTCEERVSKNGGNLFYVTVEAEFDLVSAEDGSKHTIRTYGDARDERGNVIARAWCEATVVRNKAFIDPRDQPDILTTNLRPLNKRFGRRFEIVSFRWLSATEI